jgi:hypothetical protein
MHFHPQALLTTRNGADTSVGDGTMSLGCDKGYHGGYQMIGRTDGGRMLKLIVYEKSKGLIRVITGWDV